MALGFIARYKARKAAKLEFESAEAHDRQKNLMDAWRLMGLSEGEVHSLIRNHFLSDEASDALHCIKAKKKYRHTYGDFPNDPMTQALTEQDLPPQIVDAAVYHGLTVQLLTIAVSIRVHNKLNIAFPNNLDVMKLEIHQIRTRLSLYTCLYYIIPINAKNLYLREYLRIVISAASSGSHPFLSSQLRLYIMLTDPYALSDIDS